MIKVEGKYQFESCFGRFDFYCLKSGFLYFGSYTLDGEYYLSYTKDGFAIDETVLYSTDMNDDNMSAYPTVPLNEFRGVIARLIFG